MQNVIIYKGENFYLKIGRSYYESNNKDKDRLLHRRMWADEHGEIPAGFQIHHINGDCADNRLDNFELISPQEHTKMHSTERMSDPQFRAARLIDLKKAQIKAAEWHSSPEGRAWHSEHAKRSWENRKPVLVKCGHCGKDYEALRPEIAMYCSNQCMQKAHYTKNKTAQGVCVICGAKFLHHKYSAQATCSRSCGAKLRWGK